MGVDCMSHTFATDRTQQILSVGNGYSCAVHSRPRVQLISCCEQSCIHNTLQRSPFCSEILLHDKYWHCKIDCNVYFSAYIYFHWIQDKTRVLKGNTSYISHFICKLVVFIGTLCCTSPPVALRIWSYYTYLSVRQHIRFALRQSPESQNAACIATKPQANP